MKKTLILAFAVMLSFAIAGCLQEKQLDQGNIPTTAPVIPTATATAKATSTPTATAGATSTPTPTATVSASPTFEPGGTCTIITPQNRDSFSKTSVVQLLVTFTDLPQSVTTAVVKCDSAGSGNNMDITRSQSAGTYFTKSCSYSTSRGYTISVTAGGAACSKIITITD